MEFQGEIRNSKLHFWHRDAFVYALNKSDGQKFTLTIGGKKRTLPQNSFYWGVVLLILSQETGHSVEELHEYFRGKFLGESTQKVLGKFVSVPRSTTSLTTQEFSDYIEQIRAFAAQELGISIPEPGE